MFIETISCVIKSNGAVATKWGKNNLWHHSFDAAFILRINLCSSESKSWFIANFRFLPLNSSYDVDDFLFPCINPSPPKKKHSIAVLYCVCIYTFDSIIPIISVHVHKLNALTDLHLSRQTHAISSLRHSTLFKLTNKFHLMHVITKCIQVKIKQINLNKRQPNCQHNPIYWISSHILLWHYVVNAEMSCKRGNNVIFFSILKNTYLYRINNFCFCFSIQFSSNQFSWKSFRMRI